MKSDQKKLWAAGIATAKADYRKGRSREMMLRVPQFIDNQNWVRGYIEASEHLWTLDAFWTEEER